MSEIYRLSNAHLELEERKGYLFARVRGLLVTAAEVGRAASLVRDAMTKFGERRLLIDAQQLDLPLPDPACHAAWEFIHAKDYTMLACTLPLEPGDLMVTRMNMTSLSSGLPLRAFSNILDAHRWLDLRPSGIHRRPSSMLPIPDQGHYVASSSSSSSQFPATRSAPAGKKRPSEPPSRR